jgi:hypothetical protein
MEVTAVNTIAELERCGIVFEFAGADEIKIVCPFHDDKSPSCGVNVRKGLFRCQSAECGKTGDVVTLLARYLKTTRAVVLHDLATRYDLVLDKTISPAIVEEYHARIWNAGPLLDALHARGVTDELIRYYRFGEYEGRVTIPITNRRKEYVNLRKYLPGAPGKDKMRNAKGFGEIRLYPIEQLEFPEIVVCGGECKAIVAAYQLNAYNIGALCATAGESNWDVELTKQLAGKAKIWVCLDIDKGGKAAAELLALQLRQVAHWVGVVELPLDPDKYPKGDVNDFVKSEGGQLHPLLIDCPEYEPKIVRQEFTDLADPVDLDLTHAIHADRAKQRVRVKSVVSTMDTAPYIIPKEIDILCSRDEKCCGGCQVYLTDSQKFIIPAESPAILEMVAAPLAGQMDVIKKSVGIPKQCRSCDFQATTHYNVEDARVSPNLEITNRSADRVMQPALCIGGGLELNECYHFVGRMFPHPKTQQATLLISSYEPTQDALSSYKCDDLGDLAAFWPIDWSTESIDAKLAEIYDDLAANVTHIFRRRDIHLIADLTYHSPLLFDFDGKVTKGWVETLVLGDSAQGKTECVLGLQRHYNLGEKIECKNATVAGLLGGLQQMGTRWFVSWGLFPTHDKRLVILEELKGAHTETISKLTDMRSSGIAEIPKIEKRRTAARTRFIALSNPRSDMKMAQYSFGIQAVKELIGGLEDVRRFDAVLLVSSNEINADDLNVLQRERPQVPHVYTGDLCRKLILWTWTRTREQVIFTEDAVVRALHHATELCSKFTDAIPIVDRGSMRVKLARLAAALAGRLFSCDETGEKLIVHAAHVDYIAAMLERWYSSPVFGYLDFTRALQLTQNLLDPDEITNQIRATPYPRDLVKALLAATDIELTDFRDWCGWEQSQAQILLSFFVRKHALARHKRIYRKTTPFILYLKNLLDTSDSLLDVPAHIPRF